MIRVQTENFGMQTTLKCATKKGPWHVEKHIHQFWEIILVREGELTVEADDFRGVAKAGDIVLISPFRVHSYESQGYVDIWLSVFSDSFVSDFKDASILYYTSKTPIFTPNEKLLAYFKSRLVDTGEQFIYDNLPLFRRMKAALFAIYEQYTTNLPTVTSGKSGLASTPVLALMLYLSEHFTEDLTLDTVSKAIGYNPEYISHCLTDIEGINFRYILNSFRVDFAKKLLYSTDKTIPDIAVEAGFSCERSFHRVFSSMTGKTPAKYRKEWYYPHYITSDNVDFSLPGNVVDIGEN